MKLQYILGIAIFTCTIIAYGIFLVMGRRWRNDFEIMGVTYWTAPKEKRVSDLINTVWQPKLVTSLYGLAYFVNGYTRIVFSVWIPFFLFQERGLNSVDVALFVGLIYVSWSWKMFIGILIDAFPIRFRDRLYRRLPWFLTAGLLYLIGALIFLFFDPTIMPIWTTFLPTILLVTTAGAFLDIAADSYAVDTTPPEWHGRVLGTASRLGRVIGGSVASLIPPILLNMGGFRLVFLTASMVGLLSFISLIQKEPLLEKERLFSREAIAFTFTEKTVVLGCLTMLTYSFSLRPVASSLGGMFVFIVKEVIGVSPELVGRISLFTLISGIPASVIGGWASDRWGHKKVFIASSMALGTSGFLWLNLEEGMIIWFIISATIIGFFYTINLASLLALMGDITPLALSSTVYQMYMSFVWIGNIPVSVIIGYLLTVNLPLCIGLMIFFTLSMSIFAHWINPFEVAKAAKT